MKCQAVSTTLCDFYMVHHILRTSTQSSNAFRSESFPQSRSSCCSAFARESAVYRICPKSCSALFGAGRKGSTFHFYRCAAFGFPVRHHIPCFSEKAVCRPCDALTEGKTQRTEGLFYGLHRFRGRFCIPGGRKIVIGCTLIPQRFGRDKKFVLCHFGQHAARACRNNFPAPASNETIHKLRRSGRSQWA